MTLFAGVQLELASVKLRAAELFPAGATVPAVKPRLPSVAKKPTNVLASVAFAASKSVSTRSSQTHHGRASCAGGGGSFASMGAWCPQMN